MLLGCRREYRPTAASDSNNTGGTASRCTGDAKEQATRALRSLVPNDFYLGGRPALLGVVYSCLGGVPHTQRMNKPLV